MARRRHHYRLRFKEDPELNVTTFLNLMVVLTPFLLITAVFSRISIVELNLPTNSGGAALVQPTFRVEVIVRDAGLQITNGRSVIASIPKVKGQYDLKTLSRDMVQLKRDYPKVDSASVLLEPDIPYDYLIRVMDAVRTAAIPGGGENPPARVTLFPKISIGDAP